MERSDEGTRCNLIYYCTSSEGVTAALYHAHNPPNATDTATKNNDQSSAVILENVRILLDQDRGGFNEVFLCSSEDHCLERLDVYANSAATVVLVEVKQAEAVQLSSEQRSKNGVTLLQVLKTNIQGARYQKEVLPFALLTEAAAPSLDDLEADTTAAFLKAGAGDIIASPITRRGINHLVGHVMERTRPPARLVGSTMAQNLVNSIRETQVSNVPCHRPDQSLPPVRRRFVEDAVKRWEFPAHDLDMDELTYATLLMLEHVLHDEVMGHYRMERAELVAFILATRRQYKHEREVHYHNWRHAVDVTQSIYQFLIFIGICPPAEKQEAAKKKRSSVELLFSPLDGLILLVSAIGHDVGHPGVNNAFLVACNHPLAQLYNDKSVLENYHCAAYTQLLRRHWPALHGYPPFRQTLISNILATDMQRHFEYMSHLTELRAKLLETGMSVDEWPQKDRESARELLSALMMKAADISNIARSFDISAAWAIILVNEFASQGELEAELAIPTCLFGGPPDKADVLAAAQSQKGFMNLFGFPLFQGLSDIIPSISCSLDTLIINQNRWDERIAHETKKNKSKTGGHATLASSGTAHDADIIARHRESEPDLLPPPMDSPPSTPVRRPAAKNASGSPIRHPNTEERKRYITGFSLRDDSKRASAPIIGPGSLHINTGSAASRRSSKDVALDQLQHLSMFAQQHGSTMPGSRRGSATELQLSSSYPGSRRASKDGSLTTILITNGDSTGRTSPSPQRSHRRPASSSPHKGVLSGRQPQESAGAADAEPSSHSHAASSGTATTRGTQHSASTQPSSVALIDDDFTKDMHTAKLLSSSNGTSDDPFSLPSTSSQSDAQSISMNAPSTPSLLVSASKNNSSPRIVSRMTTGDSTDGSGRDSFGGLRQSRSRSRLKGLKFWKKKIKDGGIDTASETASSP